jgi:cell division protein FtsW
VRHPGEFRWETRLLGVVTLILAVLGIAECFASSTYLDQWYHESTEQVLGLALGSVLFVIAAALDYQIWRKIATPLLIATGAGLVPIAVVALIYRNHDAPGIVGHLIPRFNGSHRWIRVGAQVQVAEIARFTLIAWLAATAATLGPRIRSFNEGFVPTMGMIALIVGLVAVEPSVTVALAIGLVGSTILFVAGARIPHLLLVVAVALCAMALLVKLDAVRNKRQQVFRGPAIHCTVDEQACQSLIGFGNGGLTGKGFGKGTQKLGHLPEAYSDFLLSVFGEDWGFVGVVFLTLCFVVFCWMGFRIAGTARDPFGTYLAIGITSNIGMSAIVHAAVVTWLIPTTGLTLPFMSVGRLALVMNLFSTGVLVSIGRQRGRPGRSK